MKVTLRSRRMITFWFDLSTKSQLARENPPCNAEDAKTLQFWRLTDPREDRARILGTKDHLLEGSCNWVFDDPAFTRWWEEDNSYVLWIHGDPGKGKTMMMMAFIEQISQRLSTKPGSGALSYFFCQDTVNNLRDASAIIRGLVYILAAEHHGAIRHLTKKRRETGDSLFEGNNTLYGLWDTLLNVLQDPELPRFYLIVDALDECDSDTMEDFLTLLHEHKSSLRGRVKWVFTSRNEPLIIQNLRRTDVTRDLSLELNSSYVAIAVRSFIDLKVKDLARRKKYDENLRNYVAEYLETHAEGTFLWVALVCKELQRPRTKKWNTREVLESFPSGLEPLYDRMMSRMEQDQHAEDVEFCKKLLRMVAVAERPLQLHEIGVLSDLPENLHNLSYIEDFVTSCGSFVTIREEFIFFVHQSAKDYLTSGKGSQLFPSGLQSFHGQLARGLVKLMSKYLRRNICELYPPGIPGIPQHLTKWGIVGRFLPHHLQYACHYWTDHLNYSGYRVSKDDEFHVFLQGHLFHWLEALNLKYHLGASIIKLKNGRHTWASTVERACHNTS